MGTKIVRNTPSLIFSFTSIVREDFLHCGETSETSIRGIIMIRIWNKIYRDCSVTCALFCLIHRGRLQFLTRTRILLLLNMWAGNTLIQNVDQDQEDLFLYTRCRFLNSQNFILNVEQGHYFFYIKIFNQIGYGQVGLPVFFLMK